MQAAAPRPSSGTQAPEASAQVPKPREKCTWRGGGKGAGDKRLPAPPRAELYLAVVTHEHDAVARVDGPGAEVALLDAHGGAESRAAPRAPPEERAQVTGGGGTASGTVATAPPAGRGEARRGRSRRFPLRPSSAAAALAAVPSRYATSCTEHRSCSSGAPTAPTDTL